MAAPTWKRVNQRWADDNVGRLVAITDSSGTTVAGRVVGHTGFGVGIEVGLRATSIPYVNKQLMGITLPEPDFKFGVKDKELPLG